MNMIEKTLEEIQTAMDEGKVTDAKALCDGYIICRYNGSTKIVKVVPA